MSSQQFKMLFSPMTINHMGLKNRVVMAPMATNFATYGGAVTDRQLEYYQARAQGGVGLIVVEATAIDPAGRGWFHNLSIHDSRFVPGLRRLARTVKEAGARIAIELFHAGRTATLEVIGSQPVAPSAIPCRGGEVPRELTPGEIRRVVQRFGEAAERAKEAEFDAIMLHMAHGYLIHQFLSAYSNKRSDSYGGDLAGRTRFAREVIGATRAAVGEGFPIICRISAEEFVEGGLTIKDSKAIAQVLEAAGVDAIDVSAGGPEAPYMMDQPMAIPRGCLVTFAHQIKKEVAVPVSVVGRINNPVLAESILQEGKADLISMGRALIADPELPKKAMEGRINEICPCIGCNQGCADRLANQLDLSCLTNAMVGREGYLKLRPTEKPRRVLIGGGGPAGLEAARVAAAQGHQVTLCEKTKQLGGQLILSAAPPHKEEFTNLLKYLVRQVESLGVAIKTDTQITCQIVDAFDPQAIILAIGSSPIIPEVPGLARCECAVTANDVLKGGGIEIGQKVAIVGGGQVGCEVAEFLAAQGREVVILEMLPYIAENMGPKAKELLLRRLEELSVEILTQSKVTKIDGHVITLDRGCVERKLAVDTIVLAVGSKPNALPEDILGLASKRRIEVHVIGDCVTSRKAFDAIHEGFAAGYAI